MRELRAYLIHAAMALFEQIVKFSPGELREKGGARPEGSPHPVGDPYPRRLGGTPRPTIEKVKRKEYEKVESLEL